MECVDRFEGIVPAVKIPAVIWVMTPRSLVGRSEGERAWSM